MQLQLNRTVVHSVFWMCFDATVKRKINCTGNFNLIWNETNKKYRQDRFQLLASSAMTFAIRMELGE